MKKAMHWLAALAMVATALVGAKHALARTQYAIGGYPNVGSDAGCFSDLHPGMSNSCSSVKYWNMPVLWDTAGGASRTVTVRGRANTNHTVACFYYSFTSTGAFAGSGTFSTITNTGTTWVSRSVTGIVVSAGVTAKVMCQIPNGGNGRVLGIDYIAP